MLRGSIATGHREGQNAVVLAKGKVASSPCSRCSALAEAAFACAPLRVALGALLPIAARVGAEVARSMGNGGLRRGL